MAINKENIHITLQVEIITYSFGCVGSDESNLNLEVTALNRSRSEKYLSEGEVRSYYPGSCHYPGRTRPACWTNC